MAAFMRSCKGMVMVSINDHPDIREAFAGFHIESTNIRYTTANQRKGAGRRDRGVSNHELGGATAWPAFFKRG